MASSSIITLTTDFGERDGYVGALKGSILCRNPAATPIDISHQISPQNLHAGAFVLCQALPFFPSGAVHLVVVDPGVGTARRPVAVRAGDHWLVGPDNGVLAPVVERLGGASELWELSVPETASATFHGRDVFGPAAGILSRGGSTPPGHRLATASLARLPSLPAPSLLSGGPGLHSGLRGRVQHVDAFGNLITNILAADVRPGFSARIGDVVIAAAVTYADVPASALVAVCGSDGFVEVAVNGGSASAELGAGVGSVVEVSW